MFLDRRLLSWWRATFANTRSCLITRTQPLRGAGDGSGVESTGCSFVVWIPPESSQLSSSSSKSDVLFRDCMRVAHKHTYMQKNTTHIFLKQDCWAQRNIPLILTLRIKAGIKGQPGLHTELQDYLMLHNRTLSQNKMTKPGLWLLFQMT